MPQRIFALAALALLVACGSSDGDGTDVRDTGATDTTGGDVQADAEADIDESDAGPDTGEDIADTADVADPDASDASDAACATLGCACADDADCDSGYCLETPRTGALVCSELCDGDCSQPGFECRALENAGSDLVRLCVPEGDPYCQPCEVPADCGSLRTACVRLDDGTSGCATPCDASGLCPTGAECVQLTSDGDDGRFCVPAEGVCEGCYDPDGDLHGLGPDCLGGDHDQLDPDSYEGAPELCDGADNDGDGERDEGFDLQTDDDNCGRCGARCADVPGSTGCDAGVCVVPGCEEGRADCDGLADNGCEVDLSDAARCGTCVLPEVAPGTACGACNSGAYACIEGGDTACVGDLGDAARNDCGGCDLLDELPGEACGLCGLDELVCNGLNDTTCDGDTAGNACGGCTALEGAPDTACGTCGLDTWACDGAEAVVCSGDTRANVCGGCSALVNAPEDRCGTCNSGTYVCQDDGSIACVGDLGDDARNDCGGCDPLEELPGDACGLCGLDELVCNGLNDTICDGNTAGNACGGCTALAGEPDTACGTCGLDTWACDGTEAVVCSGDTRGNGCGGCGVLDNEPDAACGACGLDTFVCDGTDATVCSGDTRANACGGCDALANEPEAACGACGLDTYVCDGADATVCDGDTRSNECGGCTELSGVVGEPCTPCDGPECEWVCDGAEALACSSNDRLIGLEVLIPAGSFTSGSPRLENGRSSFETQHEVTLTRAFYLGATEVAVREWTELMGTPGPNTADCDTCPIRTISLHAALAYANARSAAEGLEACFVLSGCTGTPGAGCAEPGRSCDGYVCETATVSPSLASIYDCEGYRLPTYAEWEYAARGGTTSAFWAGELLSNDSACGGDEGPERIAHVCQGTRSTTLPVGSTLANPWGLYDMLGNASEYPLAWRTLREMDPQVDPWSQPNYRALSGSFADFAYSVRSAFDRPVTAGDADYRVGLRLARTAPDAEGPTDCEAGERNGCGGCLDLPAAPDAPCGICDGGTWTCDGVNRVVCDAPLNGQNACGGCAALAAAPGDTCACDGEVCELACEASRNDLTCEDRTPRPDLFISIPSTHLDVGAPSGELGRDVDDGPVLTQFLQTSYRIGVTEVTEALWTEIMGGLPARMPDACGDSCPVTWVTFWDALAFANAYNDRFSSGSACYDLSSCTGTPGLDFTCSELRYNNSANSPLSCSGRYRLPTEAEWEYAARHLTTDATWAGELTATDCSDTTLPPIAWFCGNASSLQPVAGRDPNPFGLYDMLGNASEWVGDRYATERAGFYQPTGPSSGSQQVVRGGSWVDPASDVRSAARQGMDPDTALGTLGFRLVRNR